MRSNTSYRVEEKLKLLIKRNGGAAYIEGCVLLAHLSGLSTFVLRLSLEYETKNFPDLSSIYLAQGAALNFPKGEEILISKQSKEAFDYERVIKTVSDIPSDVPREYREAVEDLLEALGEREDLNI